VSHVPRFSFFSPYSRSYTVHFSFSTLLSGSCLILGYTMFVTHFLPFVCLIDFSAYSRSYSVFFFFFFRVFQCFSSIFHVLKCVYLIFHVFQYSRQIPILQCAFLISHVFHCFLPYSTSYHVCFSFSTFFCFLAIIQVLMCTFLTFQLIQFSLPYSRFYSVYFSFFFTFFIVTHHIFNL
jgi:hypothetical protein